MDTSHHTAPGFGIWLIMLLSLLLAAAALARAEDRATPEHGAPRHAHVSDEHGHEHGRTDREAHEAIAHHGHEHEASSHHGHEHGNARHSRHARAIKPPRPCLNKPVVIVRAHGRAWEASPLHLTLCDGSPNLAALDTLSILARPHGVDRPTRRDRRHAPSDRFVAPHIIRLNPGLLTRLQALADHWPHHRIEIVSGYRPGSPEGSRHHHGRALDLRVHGIPRLQVVHFARTLDDSGVGYYPNSTFTHVDVRDHRTYWVDRSGPGETPDYGPWPPRPAERQRIKEEVLSDVYAALDELDAEP